GERLVLPRGEYRLVVAPPDEQDKYSNSARRHLRGRQYVAGAALFLAFNAICWFWLTAKSPNDSRIESILWSGMTKNSATVLIVSG
ncbi:hypothetical protein SB758_38610, partial [Burkholderia sp. SIMBA_013]